MFWNLILGWIANFNYYVGEGSNRTELFFMVISFQGRR